MLQDHFHPPLSARRHWHAFHNAWATYLAADLNQKLPEGYFAEPNVLFGIEIDVAAFKEPFLDPMQGQTERFSTESRSPEFPPPPIQTLPFLPNAETVEIGIFNSEGGPVLTGAIELVSPANKDRQEHRNAFISKCETYLRQGLGLVIVDVVTAWKVNLHNQLLSHLGGTAARSRDDLYAAAYQPVERDGQFHLDIWQEPLSVGRALPTMPLWLRIGNLACPLN